MIININIIYPQDDESKLLKTYTNLNNNNNNIPLKHQQTFEAREVTFDKRYNDQVKSYDNSNPLEIKTYEKPLALPLHSPFSGKSYHHNIEEPMKLVKPLKRQLSHNDDEEEDDDEDHLLVIAHRESRADEESDHESSERSDRADDSA